MTWWPHPWHCWISYYMYNYRGSKLEVTFFMIWSYKEYAYIMSNLWCCNIYKMQVYYFLFLRRTWILLYFQAIPYAIAMVRAADKKSPREAVEFVLQLLKARCDLQFHWLVPCLTFFLMFNLIVDVYFPCSIMIILEILTPMFSGSLH